MGIYYFKSPIGNLEIICENDTLVSLRLSENTGISDKGTVFSRNLQKQLSEYFAGKRKSFDIKINPKGTDFQKEVWFELLKIPYGITKSYSDIAKSLGNINAQRAVGSACNKNPIMIIIPCHRVVSKNGKIGGFACGNLIKEKLLNLENAVGFSQNHK